MASSLTVATSPYQLNNLNELSSKVSSNQGPLLLQPAAISVEESDDLDPPNDSDYSFRSQPILEWRSKEVAESATRQLLENCLNVRSSLEDLFSTQPSLRSSMGHLFEVSFHNALCTTTIILGNPPSPFNLPLPIAHRALVGSSPNGFTIQGVQRPSNLPVYLLPESPSFPVVDSIIVQQEARYMIQIISAQRHSFDVLHLAQIIDRLMQLLPFQPSSSSIDSSPAHCFVVVGRIGQYESAQSFQEAFNEARATVQSIIRTMKKRLQTVLALTEPSNGSKQKAEWRGLRDGSLRTRVSSITFKGFVWSNQGSRPSTLEEVRNEYVHLQHPPFCCGRLISLFSVRETSSSS